MISQTHFPSDSVHAGPYTTSLLKNRPGKTYGEQDIIDNLILGAGYWHIKEMYNNPKLFEQIASLSIRPKPREMYTLGSYIVEDEDQCPTKYTIYLHKKSGNYYKYQEHTS